MSMRMYKWKEKGTKSDKGLKRMIGGILKDRQGINTVEIVILLAVLIGLVLLFKDYITEFLQKVFDSINRDTNSILHIIVPFLIR